MELRDLLTSDSTRMLEWMQNEDISSQFQFDFAKMQLSDVLSFIERAKNSEHDLHLAISENQLYMGTISLKNIDRENGHAEYAIVLHSDAIGSGIAPEATDVILRRAFFDMKLTRVYLNVLACNQRAVRFYQKYGFVYEGTFEKHIFHRGRFQDLYWFRMLKCEFERRNETRAVIGG